MDIFHTILLISVINVAGNIGMLLYMILVDIFRGEL